MEVFSPTAAITTADVDFILQGVIWLVLGTAAELTPVVSLAWFLPRVFRAHDPFMLQLFICLFLNGSFLHPDLSLKCCVDRISLLLNVRCAEYCMSLFDTIAERCRFLIPFHETDVPDALATHDVDRGDTDVSLFVRRYDLHRQVRPPFLAFVTALTNVIFVLARMPRTASPSAIAPVLVLRGSLPYLRRRPR